MKVIFSPQTVRVYSAQHRNKTGIKQTFTSRTEHPPLSTDTCDAYFDIQKPAIHPLKRYENLLKEAANVLETTKTLQAQRFDDARNLEEQANEVIETFRDNKNRETGKHKEILFPEENSLPDIDTPTNAVRYFDDNDNTLYLEYKDSDDIIIRTIADRHNRIILREFETDNTLRTEYHEFSENPDAFEHHYTEIAHGKYLSKHFSKQNLMRDLYEKFSIFEDNGKHSTTQFSTQFTKNGKTEKVEYHDWFRTIKSISKPNFETQMYKKQKVYEYNRDGSLKKISNIIYKKFGGGNGIREEISYNNEGKAIEKRIFTMSNPALHLAEKLEYTETLNPQTGRPVKLKKDNITYNLDDNKTILEEIKCTTKEFTNVLNK